MFNYLNCNIKLFHLFYNFKKPIKMLMTLKIIELKSNFSNYYKKF